MAKLQRRLNQSEKSESDENMRLNFPSLVSYKLSKMQLSIAFIVLFMGVLNQCCAYNIDLESNILHQSPQPDTMFGFTVAMHQDSRGVSR